MKNEKFFVAYIDENIEKEYDLNQLRHVLRVKRAKRGDFRLIRGECYSIPQLKKK